MSKADIIRQHILSNFTADGVKILTWRDLAIRHDVDRAYMMALVGRMKRQGLLPESEAEQTKRLRQSVAAKKRLRQLGMPVTPSGPLGDDSGASLDVLDGILNLPGSMPREERIKKLSNIARSGSELAQIKAMQFLEEMERAAGSSYGPPPPSSREDTIALILELLRSIDPSWVKEAIDDYSRTSEEAAPEASNPESSGPASSDSELGGRPA